MKFAPQHHGLKLNSLENLTNLLSEPHPSQLPKSITPTITRSLHMTCEAQKHYSTECHHPEKIEVIEPCKKKPEDEIHCIEPTWETFEYMKYCERCQEICYRQIGATKEVFGGDRGWGLRCPGLDVSILFWFTILSRGVTFCTLHHSMPVPLRLLVFWIISLNHSPRKFRITACWIAIIGHDLSSQQPWGSNSSSTNRTSYIASSISKLTT